MQNRIRSRLARIIPGCVALFAATAAWAVPVNFDTWYEFGFFGKGGMMAFEGTKTTPVAGTSQAGGSQWSFTGPAQVTLTDNFGRGDSFSLFDNGILVGSTPVVAVGAGGTPGVDPEVAFLDPTYSHGIFDLGPGEHSLAIRVDKSPFWAGAGFFKVTQSSVPDGGSHLLLIGLGALALFRRFLCPQCA